MFKYELIVYWSAEDEAFVVDVPELPGCMAHGPTPAEAVASAQEAITLWIRTARELGRAVPVAFSGRPGTSITDCSHSGETFVFTRLRARERRAGRTGSLFFWSRSDPRPEETRVRSAIWTSRWAWGTRRHPGNDCG